ncbi:hypothetical protein GW17_00013657 [Ensete ventricosum]|nr:hypothetical protein GW17_00013657 [Ensete ventricosum]
MLAEALCSEQGLPYLAVRPRSRRFVDRPLPLKSAAVDFGHWRSISTVNGQLREKEEGEEEEGEKYLACAALPWFLRTVRRPRAILRRQAIPSPCVGRRNLAIMHYAYCSIPGTVPYRDKPHMPVWTGTANLGSEYFTFFI